MSNCDTGWGVKDSNNLHKSTYKKLLFVETYCGELEHIFTQGTVFCTVTCIFEKVPTYCVMTWSCHNRCDTNLTQGENIKQLGYQNVVAKNIIFF